MSRLVVLALDADAPLTSFDAEQFAPAQEASISEVRAQIEEAPGNASAYVLTVGAGLPLAIDRVDWSREVITPLRRAFGFATGVARRLRNRRSGGSIVFVLPSSALLPTEPPSARAVLLRALLGMAEALRAELGPSPVRASIVFHARGEDPADFRMRVTQVMAEAPMYSLSADIDGPRIRAYFAPVFAALDATSAGPPLPDIGPMAVVYDRAHIASRQA